MKPFEDKNRIGLWSRGHANFVKKGDDIVCSAVSAIVQTAMLGCQQYDANTNIRCCQKGHFSFTCQKSEVTQAIIEAAFLGLDNIRKQYPQCFFEKV